MADITDFVSGGIIGKLDILSGRPPAAHVIAYVEGEDDVAFWGNVLSNFPKYKFRVTVNRSYQVNGNYPNGKAALMHINNLSKEKIVCIDADLDLIVKNYSHYSRRLRRDPFVFNTQYYAMENVLSQPPLLAEVVKTITGEDASFDFDSLMKRFSNTAFLMFLLYLACIKEKRLKKFSLEDLKAEVCKIRLTKSKDIEYFHRIKMSWISNFSGQISRHITTMNQYKVKLKQMGYKGRDCYKLMQGHCLYNCMVKDVLVTICRSMLEKRLAERILDTPSPDYAALKKEVYSFPGGQSLRDYINTSFYGNYAVRYHVPSQLQSKLDATYN